MELISREDLLKQIEIDSEGNRGQYGDEWFFIDTIKSIPTIESRPKGKWQKISPAGIYECTNCHQHVMTGDIDCYDFCHGCGADMRGEK